jgi:ribonucleoside-diphosphate reductase alpha chain
MTTIPKASTVSLEQPPWTGIPLTENQRKVIRDKYLRDAPSIESWLWDIAKNIALAELLYVKDAPRDAIMNGVHATRREAETGFGKSELLLVHDGLRDFNERQANHARFIANLYKAASENDAGREAVYSVARQFYDILANFDFLPNSPTLMNAGRDLQQLSACFVFPIDDSVEAWGELLKNVMVTHKSGGGTGFSGCRVRPKGDMVKSTKGVASGALSPLHMINHITSEIKQGGTRRGANMGIMPYWHPDVLDFIHAKGKDDGTLENFNVSVAVDSHFMQAVKEGAEYDLINPRTGKAVGKANAAEVFGQICEYAWKTGDPGVIFLDRINASCSNPTPALGQIEATNPCGEQPLLPFEPCNLASINLSKFVVRGEVDWQRLGEVVRLGIRFLDNVIDVNNYPLPEVEAIAKGNRRIGLGVMGWAEMLALLGIPYDSEAALLKGEEVMAFINRVSLEASEALAKERGPFPNIRQSIYDENGTHAREGFAGRRPRNCARTTIAPTGTIAIAAGLQGGGIEPFFAISYTRYNAKALDALKQGVKPNDQDVFHEVNPLFRTVAGQAQYFGLKEDDLWRAIEANHTSVRGITAVPSAVQKVFATAHDVPVEYHVKMQAAFQKHVDNGVSKTINLPHEATVEDIRKTYILAWELGCKGITVYRDGCKSQQVLNLKPAEKKAEKRDLSQGMEAAYYKFETGWGPVHIHLDHDQGRLRRVFVHTTPIGTEISGLTAMMGILLSKYLENGGDVAEVRKHLNSIKSDRPYGFGPNRIESIPHAVSVAISRFLQQHGRKESNDPTKQATLPAALPALAAAPAEKDEHGYCPKCYSPNIAYTNGCSGPTCYECGYSECS